MDEAAGSEQTVGLSKMTRPNELTSGQVEPRAAPAKDGQSRCGAVFTVSELLAKTEKDTKKWIFVS
jgi:hypothetical protein